jgi:hypothetical protein
MMSGMGRIFSYENSANTILKYPTLSMLNENYLQMTGNSIFMARLGIESNGSDGKQCLQEPVYKLSTLWHLGYH